MPARVPLHSSAPCAGFGEVLQLLVDRAFGLA